MNNILFHSEAQVTETPTGQAAPISVALLFQLLLTNSSQAIYWKDKYLVYQGCNQQFAELAGLSHESELVGKSEQDMPWIDSNSELQKAYASDLAIMESLSSKKHEIKLLKSPSGKPAWFEISRIPILDAEGGLQGIIGLMEDISAYKVAEQALRESNERLEQSNLNDSLTGLPNRKYFENYLAREIKRSDREGQDLGVIVFEIDDFKMFNEVFGAEAGDDCLIKVAMTAQQSARRPADFLARYSGKKFALALPNTSPEGTLHVADLIRSSVERLELSPDDEESRRVTLSLGVATKAGEHELSATELLSQASQILESAKQLGKNRALNY
ncbi:MAG: sensor domain-containing diguanylate cyclase [Trueperaceae bacterium]|nr:sensor domain-containing diguanylate cyclase [Trueperaceae bacterium]